MYYNYIRKHDYIQFVFIYIYIYMIRSDDWLEALIPQRHSPPLSSYALAFGYSKNFHPWQLFYIL